MASCYSRNMDELNMQVVVFAWASDLKNGGKEGESGVAAGEGPARSEY